MTIGYLKKMIAELPDNMRIYADDGLYNMFDDNSEFVTIELVSNSKNNNMCILQTKNDFETDNEIMAWYEQVKAGIIDEDTFWNNFYETGYDYDDFKDLEMQRKALKYKKES